MLNCKQRLFVSAYVRTRNATQAAIEAGYSEKAANPQGARLLANASIRAAIDDQIGAIEAASLITTERVLREYARIGFFDPRKLYDESGNLKKITDLDDDTAAAITGIDVVSIGNSENGIGELKKIRFEQKKGALDSIAKILGMMIERRELSGKNGGPIRHALEDISESQAKKMAREYLINVND